MITGENMGLAAFNNNWFCDKCGEYFNGKDDFIYCPMCGNVLKNDWYQMRLQYIEEFLNELEGSICENCEKKFDREYNFCPLCSNELKKVGIMNRIEKDNSITSIWNGEEICIFNKAIFLSSPHFSGDAVVKCFECKDYLDNKLKSDFTEISLKSPKKLTYEETFSIVELDTGGNTIYKIKFVPEISTDILEEGCFEPKDKLTYIDEKDYNRILKIRKNLYVLLNVRTDIIF